MGKGERSPRPASDRPRATGIPERDEEGPSGDRLLRDYCGMYRVGWPDDPGVEFHLGHGGWIGLLRRCGFEVEGLLEIRPP